MTATVVPASAPAASTAFPPAAYAWFAVCALSLISLGIGPFAAAASLRHGLD